MLTRAQKQDQIDGYKSTITPSQGLFALDFTGLTVGEVTELRRKVREVDATYVVVKNTLAKIAVTGSSNETMAKLMIGPTAVAYTSSDVVNLAKVLADFAKGHDKLKFRGGLVEGQFLDAKQAQQVATLPTKLELVARLLFLLQSPMKRLVTALNWPIRSVVVSLDQVAKSKESQA
jgi:large subunit ribosomal protein L10